MKKHTVVQGENLTRIAKKYGFVDYKDIYGHASNVDFRALRVNPSNIYPGDVLTIPDLQKGKQSATTGGKSSYKLNSSAVETLNIKIQDINAVVYSELKVELLVEGSVIDVEIGNDGVLKVEVPERAEKGILKLFLNEKVDDPTHVFELLLGHLDPVEAVSGVQARCNALSFNCGDVDGIMGDKTESGLRAFQDEYGLEVDGIPGPLTQDKLRAVYGS